MAILDWDFEDGIQVKHLWRRETGNKNDCWFKQQLKFKTLGNILINFKPKICDGENNYFPVGRCMKNVQ